MQKVCVKRCQELSQGSKGCCRIVCYVSTRCEPRGSQTVVPGPVYPAATPGNLFEMHILRPHPRVLNQTFQRAAQKSVLNKSSRWFKFENNCGIIFVLQSIHSLLKDSLGTLRIWEKYVLYLIF